MTSSVLATLRQTLNPAESAAFFSDFDGTLSSIVVDPTTARPVAGAAEALEQLSSALGRVTLVSGRPVSFLAQQVSERIDLVGLYGFERRISGAWSEDERVAPWREPVAAAVAAASSGPSAMLVEDKGVSLTVHYRESPELESEVVEWAEAQAAATGLIRRGARMSQELHPPVPIDKGSVVAELSAGFGQVVYCGDDAGDRSAFEALTEMGRNGTRVLRVISRGRGTPKDLIEMADAVADGPEELVAALIELADELAPRV